MIYFQYFNYYYQQDSTITVRIDIVNFEIKKTQPINILELSDKNGYQALTKKQFTNKLNVVKSKLVI